MAQPAVYLRVSSDIQRERETIKSQEDALKLWLESQGLTPDDVRWYRDDGVSGKTPIMARGDGARLVADVQARLISGFVAVFSISRISRETADFFGFRTLLREHNIALLGVSEGIDTRTESGDFVAGIHALLADEAQRHLRRASMAGLKRKAREGKWIARPPYGYFLVEGELQIDEPTAAVVRTIFRLYLEGKGAHQLADHLNALAIPSPGKTKWQTNIILRILHNPVYMGEGRWNVAEMQLGRRTGRKRPEHEHIIIPTPAIVTPEDWHRAQQRLAQGAKQFARTGKSAEGTLLSRVRCLVCGRHYYRAKAPHKGGNYYYRHDDYRGANACISENVPAIVIDDIVWGRSLTAIRNPYIWLNEMKARRDQLHERNHLETELVQVEESLARNAAALTTLDNMALHGGLTLDRYTPRALELNQHRTDLEMRRASLHRQLQQTSTRVDHEQSLAAVMEAYQQRAAAATFAEKQQIVDRLISCVRVRREGTDIEIEIEWA